MAAEPDEVDLAQCLGATGDIVDGLPDQPPSGCPGQQVEHRGHLLGQYPSLLAADREHLLRLPYRRCPSGRVDQRTRRGGPGRAADLKMLGGQHRRSVHHHRGHVDRQPAQAGTTGPASRRHKHVQRLGPQATYPGLGGCRGAREDRTRSCGEDGDPQLLVPGQPPITCQQQSATDRAPPPGAEQPTYGAVGQHGAACAAVSTPACSKASQSRASARSSGTIRRLWPSGRHRATSSWTVSVTR